MKNTALIVIAVITLTACGPGAFQRITTIGGLVKIEHPYGDPVTCYMAGHDGGVFCFTDKQMRDAK